MSENAFLLQSDTLRHLSIHYSYEFKKSEFNYNYNWYSLPLSTKFKKKKKPKYNQHLPLPYVLPNYKIRSTINMNYGCVQSNLQIHEIFSKWFVIKK